MNEAAGLASPHRERMMWLIAKRNSNDCGGASIMDPDNAEFWKYEMLRWNNLQDKYRKDYIELTANERN